MKTRSQPERDHVLSLWRAYLGWSFGDVERELGAKATLRATGARNRGRFTVCRDSAGVRYAQYSAERRILTAACRDMSVEMTHSNGQPLVAETLEQALFIVESALLTNAPEALLWQHCAVEKLRTFTIATCTVLGKTVRLVLDSSSGRCAEVRVDDFAIFVPRTICALQVGRRFYAKWNCGTDSIAIQRFATGVKLYAGERSMDTT